LIRLKKATVSDSVLKVMMDSKAAITPAPMVVQMPIVAGVPTVRPSGATPSPNANMSGDLNDPMTPHDSGIYLYTKDRDGKPK
jgi:hypothetical protein